MGPRNGYRQKLFRAVHAEALKRGFDHDALREVCRQAYGVHSMSEVRDDQLASLYKQWTGKGIKRQAKLPRAGEAKAPRSLDQVVSSAELLEFERECARREWGPETRRNFIRRQLQGRDIIRTRRDFVRVFSGIRAMNRRAQKESSYESAS